MAEDSAEASPEDQAIGQRVGRVRRKRDMTLEVAAGLAGLSKGYLSKLENGKKGFTRRGLIEDIAEALGCSVADLTGQPYLAPDRQSASAASGIPALAVAVYDATLDDVPDVPARPVAVLAQAAREANAQADHVQYAHAGHGLAALLIELQVHVVSGDSDTQRAALAALVEACMAAQGLARTLGHAELALTLARRGYDAARRLERDDLVGLMAMNRGHALMRIGARHRASAVLKGGLDEAAALPGPTPNDTTVGEARGMLHLSAALLSARDGRTGDADTHLAEASALAAHTGERNFMRYHFGPTNVAAWKLTVAVETCTGPDAAERLATTPIDLRVFDSRDRESNVYFDMARAWAQAGGARDDQAMRALDTADRIAPIRVRNDPIARDLVMAVDRRARRRMWELESLKRRLGVS